MSKEKDVINKEQIKDWKAKYGSVYRTSVCDGSIPIIWRRLNRKEYLDLLNDVNEDMTADEKYHHRQEQMVSTVALYPENIDEIISQGAGIATILSDEILLKSGFEDVETEEL